MDIGRCMTRECKNCKYETRCFKEYKDEYKKNKNRKHFHKIITFVDKMFNIYVE